MQLIYNKPEYRQNVGFTLVEILFTTILVALLGTSIFTLSSGANKTQIKATEDLQMQANILTGQNELLRNIRESRNIVVPRPGENSPILCMIDKTNDFRVFLPIKDEPLSQKMGYPVYKLALCNQEMKTFNIDNPAFDKSKLKTIFTNLKKINFWLTNPNTITVTAFFGAQQREFQIIFDGALMNAGEHE